MGKLMAVFDLFKRLVSQNTATGERRVDARVRATLGARVLVVDDSATIRAVLGKMLMQDGYEVLKAADGETAVEMAQSQLPDLIFLDIVLPGISGFAVLRSLRRDTRTHTTPIIMMSGNQQATEQFYVQRFGADGFVKKPFGRVEVFQAVRSLIQAGRMPAREIMPAPVAGIPEGMSPEEWAAIPDVALPDDDHVGSGPALPGDTPPTPATDGQAAPSTAPPALVPGAEPAGPSVAATDRPANRRDTAFEGAAVSMAMRPTVATGARATPGPRITVHVARPHKTVADAAGDSADAWVARTGEGDEA
ncbi:MAG TPA: response regulator [Rhodanobacteraceae bacterium]|nr:response regulator [Rhodanobacteraceae bacterium]